MQPKADHRKRATTESSRIELALAAGRTFEAVDLARAALAASSSARASAHQSLSWLAATAFLRSGAEAEARAEIERLEAAARRPIGGPVGALRARLLEELWQTSHATADLERALDARLARARAGGFSDLAAAALLAKAQGQDDLASRLATSALASTAAPADPVPDRLLDEARLALVQGNNDAAERALHELGRRLARLPLERAQVRRALLRLSDYGMDMPTAALAAFPEPSLVIYCGAADPALGGSTVVKAAIREALDAVNAEIAYGSALAGAELLFAQAALDRGAELNLLLPCQPELFRERMIVSAGAPWPQLFDAVLAKAASTTSITDDRQTVDARLLQFANRVIDGTARLRAERLTSRPTLIAAYDPLADSGPGGAGDFIDHWGDPARLRLVDLDDLGFDTSATAPAPSVGSNAEQHIAGLLFADVVGFTRLDDALLPHFWRFMSAVGTHMRTTASTPRMLRSWGDAVFVMAESALATADYAMALKAAFAAVDARAFGLPDSIEMRVALHAGPVFEGRHPLTAETMVYGGNVNRAARIEPITVPGKVFASAPFVAWLTAEESAAEAETRLEGGVYRPRYRCTYRGIVELAKRYGAQGVYEVDPWRLETAMPEARISGRTFSMTLSNDFSEHRRLADAIERFVRAFGYARVDLAPFEIAFDEVMTNICRYAWSDAAQHQITVEAELDDDRLVVTFVDDGVPFNPVASAAPSLDEDIDERAMGGLGIHLVRELMEEVRYVRSGKKNRLTLARRFGEQPAGAADLANDDGKMQ